MRTKASWSDSGQFSGMASAAAKEAIAAFLEEKGQGKGAVHFRLRDWLISRQRYWGAPIPIIYCEACGLAPVPDPRPARGPAPGGCHHRGRRLAPGAAAVVL